ncbi:hypothetical protein JFL47_11415 [Haemophilus haemoglobinophilus]|nr:hypothetical protein [Canicola haemoglobinophilus]MBN6711822.1 hypothetical protein [Canicola haemoglobinophilus]
MGYFDLSKSLHWQPVRLTDGRKAYIFADLRVFSSPEIKFPLLGGYFEVIENDGEMKKEFFHEMRWDLNGIPQEGNYLAHIAGMWEE